MNIFVPDYNLLYQLHEAMRRLISFISISLLFLILCSCGNDDSQFDFSDGIVHYDGENQDAPVFTAGRNDVAVRFPSALLRSLIGKKLIEVDFFIYEISESCQIIIYEGGSSKTPGTIVYTADVENQLTSDQWNKHILIEDVEIGNEDLWISLSFTNPSSSKLIGCDSGPQVADGARILRESDTSWASFEFNVNWNIRGILED